MPIDDLCGQETCTIQAANYRSGASFGAKESFGDSGADLAYGGGNAVSSPSWSFSASDIGSTLQITGGTNWTVGSYVIQSVSGGIAVLDRQPATGTPAAGLWLLNPATTPNCLAQQLSASESLRFAARGKKVTHRLFFASDVGLTNRHRVQLSDGSYLRVQGYYKRGRPGEDLMWIAELEEITTRMEAATV